MTSDGGARRARSGRRLSASSHSRNALGRSSGRTFTSEGSGQTSAELGSNSPHSTSSRLAAAGCFMAKSLAAVVAICPAMNGPQVVVLRRLDERAQGRSSRPTRSRLHRRSPRPPPDEAGRRRPACCSARGAGSSRTPRERRRRCAFARCRNRRARGPMRMSLDSRARSLQERPLDLGVSLEPRERERTVQVVGRGFSGSFSASAPKISMARSCSSALRCMNPSFSFTTVTSGKRWASGIRSHARSAALPSEVALSTSSSLRESSSPYSA